MLSFVLLYSVTRLCPKKVMWILSAPNTRPSLVPLPKSRTEDEFVCQISKQ